MGYTDEGMKYIRAAYNVPAYIDGKIRYKGTKEGVIEGCYCGRLIIDLNDGNGRRYYHPTWELEYFIADEWMCEEDSPEAAAWYEHPRAWRPDSQQAEAMDEGTMTF